MTGLHFIVPLNFERESKHNNIQNLFINFLNSNKIMNKKDLKMYEAPACEVVELELCGVLCASGNNAENIEMGDDLSNEEEGLN